MMDLIKIDRQCKYFLHHPTTVHNYMNETDLLTM
jgi:hypothetical protein